MRRKNRWLSHVGGQCPNESQATQKKATGIFCRSLSIAKGKREGGRKRFLHILHLGLAPIFKLFLRAEFTVTDFASDRAVDCILIVSFNLVG